MNTFAVVRKYSLDFWFLCFSSFLFFGSITMVLPELPGYLRKLEGEEYLGFIIGLSTLAAALSRPFSGKLADVWGRIPVMVIGSVVGFVVCLFYPFISSVTGLLMLRFFHGFATGFKPTGTSAFVSDIISPQNRGEAMGLSSFFASTGMACGPILGSIIYFNFGIDSLFYASAATSLVSILILSKLKETLPSKSSFQPKMLKIKLSDVFEPTVWPASLVMGLSMVAFGTLLTLSPDFSDHLGIPNRGMVFFFYTIASMAARGFGGKLSDRLGRVAVLKISLLIIFISMSFIGFANTPYMLYSAALIYGLGNGLTNPTLYAWTIDLCPDHLRGRGMSTLYMFLEIGIGLSSMLAGSFYQQDPSRFPIIFGLSGLLSFIGFAYLMVNRKNLSPINS